jgi:predicted hydrocarbon binding protein
VSAPQIRGTALLPRIRFIQARSTEDWQRVLEAMTTDARAAVAGVVLPSSWYPFQSFVELVVAADKLLGKGDAVLIREMGRYAATANLNTFFKFFIRLGSPEWVIGKGASMWSLSHDTGRAEVERLGPTGAAYLVKEFAAPHRALCAGLLGWMERCLELTGVKDVQIRESECAAQGGKLCRFEATWR